MNYIIPDGDVISIIQLLMNRYQSKEGMNKWIIYVFVPISLERQQHSKLTHVSLIAQDVSFAASNLIEKTYL